MRLTLEETILQYACTLKAAELSSLPKSRFPFPLDVVIRRATSDRFQLAGSQLVAADRLLNMSQFRSSIARNYYAMYHAARALTFAHLRGDDKEKHHILPRHLPLFLADHGARSIELQNARLLRNQADYDPYPISEPLWADDARDLASTAAQFVAEFEETALREGLV